MTPETAIRDMPDLLADAPWAVGPARHWVAGMLPCTAPPADPPTAAFALPAPGAFYDHGVLTVPPPPMPQETP